MLFTCIGVRRKICRRRRCRGRSGRAKRGLDETSSSAEKRIHEKVVSGAEASHQLTDPEGSPPRKGTHTHARTRTADAHPLLQINTHARTHATMRAPRPRWARARFPHGLRSMCGIVPYSGSGGHTAPSGAGGVRPPSADGPCIPPPGGRKTAAPGLESRANPRVCHGRTRRQLHFRTLALHDLDQRALVRRRPPSKTHQAKASVRSRLGLCAKWAPGSSSISPHHFQDMTRPLLHPLVTKLPSGPESSIKNPSILCSAM